MSDEGRSHWGWGWADRFGDATQREALGQMVEAILGLTPGPVKEPVALEEVELSPSRISPPTSLGDWIDDDRRRRITHCYGRGFCEIWRGFHGDFSPAPDLVARPRNEEDLVALMRWAGQESLAVVPYGGGTSVVGGVTVDGADLEGQYQGWISVDMSGFGDVGTVDEGDRTVRIGAGALGPAIEEALAGQGLTLRHFPQSFEFSTLGGWLATKAGGHFATNYTRIDDLVQSIRLVAPSGVWDTLEVPSTGAGPDPRQLILGSEGALGFITSAVMKVRPRPVYRSRANVEFADLDDAVEACRQIAQSYLFPSNCRLLDRREALFNGVVSEPKNVLLLGFESADVDVATALEQALDIALECGGVCPGGPQHRRSGGEGEDAAGRWRSAFFEAPYLQSRLLSVGIVADTFETAITWSRFDAFHRELKTRLAEEMKEVAGGGRLTLRFTHVYPDGPAPYYTFLFSPPPDKVLESWHQVRHAAADVIARHGATISHHHAVGRLHRPYLEGERSALFLEALRAVKERVDPAGILNPGVLISR